MHRADAERRLLAGLDATGFRSGRIGLPVIWPAIATWWRTPVLDVAPEYDWRLHYVSQKPADADPMRTTVFAGEAPEEIADRDLIRMDFDRQFSREVRPDSLVGLAGGGSVSLWYEAGSAWDSLRQDSGWIDLGISTPNIDWCGRGDDIDRMIAEVERDPLYAIASREGALALGFFGEEIEDLIVLARD